MKHTPGQVIENGKLLVVGYSKHSFGKSMVFKKIEEAGHTVVVELQTGNLTTLEAWTKRQVKKGILSICSIRGSVAFQIEPKPSAVREVFARMKEALSYSKIASVEWNGKMLASVQADSKRGYLAQDTIEVLEAQVIYLLSKE